MHRGFTLVEILIALTIFGMVLVMIFSGLRSAGRTWVKSEAQIEANDTSRMDLGFVRKQLGEVIPLVLIDKRDNPVLFKGEHDAVHFISNLPGHRGGGGLYLLSFHTVWNDNNKELVLSYQPVTADIDPENMKESGKVKNVTILDDIKLIEFSYFGSKGQTTNPSWSDEWQVKTKLPELIRVHIESTSDGRFIPDITARLHVSSIRGQPQLILYKGGQGPNSGAASANGGGQPDTGFLSSGLKSGQNNL